MANAACLVFPGIEIAYCWFHLSKSVMKRIKKGKLDAAYQDDEDVQESARWMVSF